MLLATRLLRRRMMTSLSSPFASFPPPLVFNPITGTPSSSLIFLHGLGDTAEGWRETAEEVFTARLPKHRVLLLNAPTIPVDMFGGQAAPAWYNLCGGRSRSTEKCEGLDLTKAYVESVIEGEVARGIPRSQISLGGFSQGGATSLFVGLQQDPPLHSVAVLSGYLPLPGGVIPSPSALSSTPFHFFHGDRDEVVPLHYSEDVQERIKGFGAKRIHSKVYPLPHSISMAELDDLIVALSEEK